MSTPDPPHAAIPPGLDVESTLRDAQRLASIPTIPPALRPAFDDLARLTAQVLGATLCFASLIGAERQVVLGSSGEAPAEWDVHAGFCGSTLTLGGPLLIGDLQEDPEAAKRPGADAGYRAYAGIPLRLSGERVGTLCAMNVKPRAWTVEDAERLSLLAVLGGYLLSRA